MEQLRFLEEEGCAEFQGFLYSPAVSASECGALMRAAKLGTVLRPGAADEEISTSR
jgi:EAL domain-containing protein (putative c-di-GMP-specific phosphodiesterase class I)